MEKKYRSSFVEHLNVEGNHLQICMTINFQRCLRVLFYLLIIFKLFAFGTVIDWTKSHIFKILFFFYFTFLCIFVKLTAIGVQVCTGTRRGYGISCSREYSHCELHDMYWKPMWVLLQRKSTLTTEYLSNPHPKFYTCVVDTLIMNLYL